MSARVQRVTGKKNCVDEGGLLVDQAPPPDCSLGELPAGLSSGLPLGSEQTNAARACLGPGPQLSAGRQTRSVLALV